MRSFTEQQSASVLNIYDISPMAILQTLGELDPSPSLVTLQTTRSLYYKRVTIVIDAPSVVSK